MRPVCTVAADYSRTMALVSDYLERVPAADRDAVLGGNAQRVWKIGGSGGRGLAHPQADPDSR